MRTRVKICGITRVEDGLAAANAGADAIGLVFYPPSPRNVSIEQAATIAAAMPPFVTVTGLFVNADEQTIADVVKEVGIDLIQFHGNECPDYCASHQRPWIKAVRMKADTDLDAEIERYSAARGILLDAYQPGIPGGTGESFDWGRVPGNAGKSIILAGGLGPENIADAIQTAKPFAVDVSGGVEAEKGIKDHDKIAAFVRGVELARQN